MKGALMSCTLSWQPQKQEACGGPGGVGRAAGRGASCLICRLSSSCRLSCRRMSLHLHSVWEQRAPRTHQARAPEQTRGVLTQSGVSRCCPAGSHGPLLLSQAEQRQVKGVVGTFPQVNTHSESKRRSECLRCFE